METKTELHQINQKANRLIVDLKINDPQIKNTIVDGLAIKHAKKWLNARTHFIKLKKWALVNPTKKEIAEIDTLEKQHSCYLRRVVFRLTLLEA